MYLGFFRDDGVRVVQGNLVSCFAKVSSIEARVRTFTGKSSGCEDEIAQVSDKLLVSLSAR